MRPENASLSLFCDATGAVTEAQAEEFCELLHTRGFAIVRLPACAHAEAAAVREAASTFFALEKEEKRVVGDFRVVGDTYVGYRDTATTRQDCDAEFLEVNTVVSLPHALAAVAALSRSPRPQPQPSAAALSRSPSLSSPSLSPNPAPGPSPSLGLSCTRCISTAWAQPSPTRAAAA